MNGTADLQKNGNEKFEMDRMIRDFENSKYFGYIFFVEYDGKIFESFDENPGKKSVKSEFRKILEKNGINIFKGIQQAGRTDAQVSAKSNALYINSRNVPDLSELKILETEGLKINKIARTMPFLEFPQLIAKRYYIYEYPQNLIKNDEDRIRRICEKVSGKRNFYEFTSEKGKKLKNHTREIFVKYENGKLYFAGDGFLPQQVRIMSNFILNDTKFDIEKLTDENFENRRLKIRGKALDGKYLTLEKVEFSEELKKMNFWNIKNIEELAAIKTNNKKNFSIKSSENGNSENKDFENREYETISLNDTEKNEVNNMKELDKIRKIVRNEYFTVFFVERKFKGEFIGKKGKNIKKLKRIFGNVVVKEI